MLDRVAVGVLGVGHGERDRAHPVAMGGDVAGDLARAEQWGGEDEADPALLEHVGGAVANAGLESRVGGPAKAERVREPVGGLGRVADVELDVVDAQQGHLVGRGNRGSRDGLRAHTRLLSSWLAGSRL